MHHGLAAVKMDKLTRAVAPLTSVLASTVSLGWHTLHPLAMASRRPHFSALLKAPWAECTQVWTPLPKEGWHSHATVLSTGIIRISNLRKGFLLEENLTLNYESWESWPKNKKKKKIYIYIYIYIYQLISIRRQSSPDNKNTANSCHFVEIFN